MMPVFLQTCRHCKHASIAILLTTSSLAHTGIVSKTALTAKQCLYVCSMVVDNAGVVSKIAMPACI
jgi:hypothetical protein